MVLFCNEQPSPLTVVVENVIDYSLVSKKYTVSTVMSSNCSCKNFSLP